MSRILDVYLHEIKAGTLLQEDNGLLEFTYDPTYLDLKEAPLSVAMPLQEKPYPNTIVQPWFSGLLPDEDARRKLARTLGVSRENTFGLLEIIGGECAGALSLLPSGQELPDFSDTSLQILEPDQLSQIFTLLRERPLLGGEQGIRLSLAGAQDKLAVCLLDQKIALPKSGCPTTHILKPSIEGLDGIIENEVFCLRLASRIGLDAPKVSKSSAKEIDFILIQRYDRLTEEQGQIHKLHQEDFCQALSVPPALKYEDEGGPGILQSKELIRQVTQNPASDSLKFQTMLIFHYLIGNADAHAKNYSLLYRNRTPCLAPVYDAICTAAYPHLSKNMAMKIGGRAKADTLHLKHWNTLVPSTRVSQRMLTSELTRISETILIESQKQIDECKELGMFHPILEKIFQIIQTRVRLLQKALKENS